MCLLSLLNFFFFSCFIFRFNATDFLERSRNGQIAFAGDSIFRNEWESLLCMLSQGVSNISTIYEENGSPITKHKGFLSIRFQEYNLTVRYYRALSPWRCTGHRKIPLRQYGKPLGWTHSTGSPPNLSGQMFLYSMLDIAGTKTRL